MKKLFLVILFIPLCINAQETDFKFTKDGFTDYVITKCDGNTQAELYKKTLQWVNQTFKDKKDTKIMTENESIIIKSSSNKLVCFNVFGKSYAKAKFAFEIAFKDGRYKFDIANNIDYLYGEDWKKLNLNDTKSYYNNKGEIRSEYKYFPEVADYFNSLNSQLKDFIMNYKEKKTENQSNPQVKKNDW